MEHLNVSVKKRILILGGNSFIARSIAPLFRRDFFTVDVVNRTQLNLLDLNGLKLFFAQNERYDCVINCAISGGGRLLKKDSVQNFYENILINENVLYCKRYFGQLIDFPSGAEYNRTSDIKMIGPHHDGEPYNDYYALAKRVNRLRTSQENGVSLRIFNVFGCLEKEDRFIKNTILKCMNDEDVVVWGDTRFDFFYIEDLFKVILWVVSKAIYSGTFNCVYEEKYTLCEIASIIKRVTNSHSAIVIKGSVNREYTGKSNFPLRSFLNDNNFYGLEKGIERTYSCLKEKKKLGIL